MLAVFVFICVYVYSNSLIMFGLCGQSPHNKNKYIYYTKETEMIYY